MIEKYADNVPLWSFQKLLPCKQISHFISTRNGGFSKPPYNSLNLGFHVGDNPEIVLENRQRLATALGIPLVNFTTVRQVHGGNVVTVKKPEGGIALRHGNTGNGCYGNRRSQYLSHGDAGGLCSHAFFLMQKKRP